MKIQGKEHMEPQSAQRVKSVKKLCVLSDLCKSKRISIKRYFLQKEKDKNSASKEDMEENPG